MGDLTLDFGAQPGGAFGIRVLEETASKLKGFQVSQLMGVRVGLVGAELFADGLEVAVARGKLAGVKLAVADPLGDFVVAGSGHATGHVL